MANEEEKKYEENKKRIRERAIETGAIVEDALRSIANRIGDIMEESLGVVDDVTIKTTKSLERELRSFATSASKMAASIGVKASEGLLKSSDIQKAILGNNQKILQLEIKRKILQDAGVENLEEIDKLLDEARLYQGIITQELEDQLTVNSNINKAMGITGNLLKTASNAAKKLGISGLDEVFSNASSSATKMAQKVTTTSKGIGTGNAGMTGKLKVMGAGLSSLGKGLVGLFRSPLLYIGLIVKALSSLKDLMFSLDQEAVNLGRNFGIAGKESYNLSNNIRSIAAETGLYNKDLVEAFTELNQVTGTFGKISDENLETYVKLTTQAGYSKELAQGLYQISVLQGKSLKEVATSEHDRIKSLAESSGLAIDQKGVFEEMSKASAATQLSIIGQGRSLGEASFQAKKLGVDFQTLNNIAGSLLDFENSIQAEMEAELLTGRQLNLEKARAAALSGDLTTLAKELNKQNIDAVSFGKMNIIQQEAIAKAMGMNRESMANSLIRERAIRKGLIQDEKTSLDQQMENLAMQEQFNMMINQLKTIFVTSLQEPLQELGEFLKDKENYAGFLDGMKNIAKFAGSIAKFFLESPEKIGAMIGALGGLVAVLTVAAIAASVASFGGAVAAGTAALALAGIVGGGMLGSSMFEGDDVENVDDAIITPEGNVIKTHADDFIIATKDPSSLGGSGSDKDILVKINESIKVLTNVASVPSPINIDSNQVETFQNMSRRQLGGYS